jgi:hypothetical protein
MLDGGDVVFWRQSLLQKSEFAKLLAVFAGITDHLGSC